MNTDKYGQIILSEPEFFESLFQGKSLSIKNVLLSDSHAVTQYNHSILSNADLMPLISLYRDPDIDVSEFDHINQKDWFIPEKYKEFDIVLWLFDQCNTNEEFARVNEELELFIQHKMYEVLVYLKYLVDTMRENKIVWGVGRGSSVASYCLYLIGVHKINSLRYNLDIREFLK